MESPPTTTSRRRFLAHASSAAGVLAASGFPSIARGSANDRVRIGVMGLHRGQAHLAGYLAHPNTEIVYICDVDQRALESGASSVEKKQSKRPRVVTDFRQMLDDPSVDAISIAAPNHWHAPAAILACKAGKHVYVEKPGSHNGRESELIVQAARKFGRKVQMGNQRRSWPFVRETMDALHSGVIGRLHLGRAWYNSARGTIGHGKPASIPDWLNYDLWQGPAPEFAYVDNLVPYNWHWRWNWGGGELANNGIHALDLVRWGLKVDLPLRVTAAGGRYYFKDDQETPDTLLTTFDFAQSVALWEGNSCHPRGLEGTGFGITFYGEGGAVTLLDNGWKVFDEKDKLVKEHPGRGDDTTHFGNFLAAIREGTPLNSEIEEAQMSTRWCHLGNIAWRTGEVVQMDAGSQRPAPNSAAGKMWTREYRPGWEPTV